MPETDRTLSDRISPVVVQEMRRATRNRGVLILGALMLIGLVGITWWFGVREKIGSLGDLVGKEYFFWCYVVYTVPVFLVIPFYVSARLLLERQNGWLEMVSATTLSEGRIVLGKVFSGMLIALFFLGLAGPFFFSSFLLRGIDVVRVLIVLVINTVLLVGVIYWVLFWMVMKVGPVVKTLFGFIALVGVLLALALALSGIPLEGNGTSVGAYVFLGVFWVVGVLFAHTIATDQIRTIRWELQYAIRRDEWVDWEKGMGHEENPSEAVDNEEPEDSEG